MLRQGFGLAMRECPLVSLLCPRLSQDWDESTFTAAPGLRGLIGAVSSLFPEPLRLAFGHPFALSSQSCCCPFALLPRSFGPLPVAPSRPQVTSIPTASVGSPPGKPCTFQCFPLSTPDASEGLWRADPAFRPPPPFASMGSDTASRVKNWSVHLLHGPAQAASLPQSPSYRVRDVAGRSLRHVAEPPACCKGQDQVYQDQGYR